MEAIRTVSVSSLQHTHRMEPCVWTCKRAACRADESLVARRMIETIGNDGQAGIAAAVVALA